MMARGAVMKGLSGSVRIMRLDRVHLSGQELHGKRLDESSQQRRVSDAPPVTTTGLDLGDLLDAHEAGAKRQGGSKYRAMHMIVQFPQDLVDGDDAELMLKHARGFAEQVFGSDAVFGDRIDRDEGNRHVVDLFLAPKYQKKTKGGEATWISLSRDLKALAIERGEGNKQGEPDLRAQGRALQSTFHEYLIEQMGLVEAERGAPKEHARADWKTPEEIKAALLAEQLGQKVVKDLGAIVAEAPELFKELSNFPGKYGPRDEKIDRCMELAEIVDVSTMFKIGGAVIEAQQGKAEVEALKVEAERDREAAARTLAEAGETLRHAKAQLASAEEARKLAEDEGFQAGKTEGRSVGRKEIEDELAPKRKAAEEDRRKAAEEHKAAATARQNAAEEARKAFEAELEGIRKAAETDRDEASKERKAAETDRQKAAQEAAEAVRKREEAEKDHEEAKTARSDAEALKSSWETANKDGAAEIERQKTELAGEREALDAERLTFVAEMKKGRGDLAAHNREYMTSIAKLRADQKNLKEGQEALDRDRTQLRSDSEELAKRGSLLIAVEAGITAWVERKIIGTGGSDDQKRFEFSLDVTKEERASIESRVKPAFDAVWGLINRAARRLSQLLRERELAVNAREAAAVERLKALDEATRARVAPEVVKAINEAPGASMPPEEFRAAQDALARLQSKGIG